MTDEQPTQERERRRRGLEGRVLAGRYEVVRTVSAGANTLIADAHDRELDRTVTVKLIRPELSESEEFRRTFRKLMDEMTHISHPNIAAVYDWGEERIGKRGTVFVVVEYLSGGSLRDLFDRGRNLTPSQALMVGLEACRGLDFAHREGLVHTELTPSKLVFGDDRRLRIVDFGLARILGEQEWRDPTRVATHVARYASPEQAQGQPLDGKTDVYSLALILVEAVTDTVPFVGDSTVSTLSARLGKLMPVSADLGPLAAVLERAGRPEPEERYSASQFGRALVRAAEKLPRPTPIPILAVTGLFDDPAAMRAPDDPTGGITRPPAAPVPALVEPSPAPVKPDDTTAEIPARAESVTVEADRSEAAATASGGERAPAESGAVKTAATAGGAGVDDLAALVEQTPQKAAPAAGREPAAARRGAKTGEPPSTTAPNGRAARKARRARKREAKARRKAETGTPKRDAAPLPVPTPARPAEPRDRRWVPWMVGVFLLVILAGLGYIAWLLFRTPTHEIPAVVGLDQDSALDLVDDFGWEIDIELGRDDTYREPGQVIRTSPAAGEDLAEGSPLLVVVSEGPEYRSVPNLAGVPLADARAHLEELELVPLPPEEQFSEDVPEGRVLSAAVAGLPVGGEVLPGADVEIVVSAGPQPRRVPPLEGRTLDAATAALTDLGLTVAVGDEVFHDEIPAGLVAVQSPEADASVDRGATVSVSLSKGPDLVTVPDLGGMTLAEIDQALQDAGLRRGTLLGARSGTFYAALVDGEQVDAGAQVRRGSEVDIIILVQG